MCFRRVDIYIGKKVSGRKKSVRKSSLKIEKVLNTSVSFSQIILKFIKDNNYISKKHLYQYFTKHHQHQKSLSIMHKCCTIL